MQGPHLVARKAPIAVKFEGGFEKAQPIMEWVLSNGHTASWIATDDEIQKIGIQWGATLFGSHYIELFPEHWLIWDHGNYRIYSDSQFNERYDDKEPLETFVERHLGDEAKDIYWPRPVAAKALQMPIQKEHEAAKDLEERVRAIAQFIDAEGGFVFDFNVKELGFSYGDDALRLEPGEWVVSDFKNDLHVFSHEYFRLFYMTAEEADRNA